MPLQKRPDACDTWVGGIKNGRDRSRTGDTEWNWGRVREREREREREKERKKETRVSSSSNRCSSGSSSQGFKGPLEKDGEEEGRYWYRDRFLFSSSSPRFGLGRLRLRSLDREGSLAFWWLHDAVFKRRGRERAFLSRSCLRAHGFLRLALLITVMLSLVREEKLVWSLIPP